MSTIPIWELAVRLMLSCMLGGVIGWDREIRGKPAGLRTIMLVTVASTTFVIAAYESAIRYGGDIDVVRAMGAIASGIGFLGAGAIMQSQHGVRWLTTAASLWAAGAVGYAVGMGLYVVAILSVTMVLVILRTLRPFERWLADVAEHRADDDA